MKKIAVIKKFDNSGNYYYCPEEELPTDTIYFTSNEIEYTCYQTGDELPTSANIAKNVFKVNVPWFYGYCSIILEQYPINIPSYSMTNSSITQW